MKSFFSKIKLSTIYKIIFYTLILVIIRLLIFEIRKELNESVKTSFNQIMFRREDFFNEIKPCSSIGWFNLTKNKDHIHWNEGVFIDFQYMIAPTILENRAYNKKIICYYDNFIQLADFCIKNKQYRIFKRNTLNNYALLERE